MKKIVTIQDISCYGQCSITVALPVLSAYGIETAILPSGILSTHTGGFKDFTFLDLTEEMPKIVEHWQKENIRFDAIYTGYIGDSRQFDIIRDTRKLLNPDGLFIVDPAMADHGKLYGALDESIVDGMRSIVREADITLPNLTEAAFLLDIPYKESYTEPEIDSMLSSLCEMGAKTAVITGVSYEPGKLGAVSLNKETGEKASYFGEWVEKSYHGTGDIFSSVVIANIMRGMSMEASIKDACEFVIKCIRKTMPDADHWYGVKFEDVLQQVTVV